MDDKKKDSLIFVSCSLCGECRERLIATQNMYKMVQCRNCGFIYLNPRPDRDSLCRMYQSYHSRNEKGGEEWAVLMDDIFFETASFIKRQVKKSGALLDVGCGYGHFLNRMRTNGWDVYGVEPAITLDTDGTFEKLNIFSGNFDDADFNENFFDVVALFYVLEHLYYPVETLITINKILKPGGYLIIRVPHTTPIVRLLSFFHIKNNLFDLPFHLSDFSPITLGCMLNKTGFTDITTFPGEPTKPKAFLEKCVSTLTGNAGKLLYKVSLKKFLLPCISKTTVCKKHKQIL